MSAPNTHCLRAQGCRTTAQAQALSRPFVSLNRLLYGLLNGLFGTLFSLSMLPTQASPQDDAWAFLAAQNTVDDAQLEEVRGGFEMENGLKLSFGFERVSYVNGVLVGTQTLNLPNLQATNEMGQIATALEHVGGSSLIQNGGNNALLLNSDTAFNNIIQNTLDQQKIETRTIINSTVNSLQILRAINLQTILQESVTGSLRR